MGILEDVCDWASIIWQDHPVILIALAIIAYVSAIAITIFLCALWQETRIVSTEDHERRRALIHELARNPNRAKRFREKLIRWMKNNSCEKRRENAFEALLLLEEASGREVALCPVFALALRDPSPVIRSLATDWLARLPSPDSLELLDTHLGAEKVDILRKRMLAAFRTVFPQLLSFHLEKEDFEAAEKLVRRFGASRYTLEETQRFCHQITLHRQQQTERRAASERETRRAQAQAEAELAARLASEGRFDEAEKAANKALSYDPSNADARALLATLPQRRQAADEDLRAKVESERIQRIEEYRVDALLALDEFDYDKATEILNILLSLNPGDEWATKTLSSMPTLQENRRQALYQKEINRRSARAQERWSAIPALMAGSDFAAAQSAAQELLALEPENRQIPPLIKQIAETIETQKADRAFQDAEARLDAGDLAGGIGALKRALLHDKNTKRASAMLKRLPRVRQVLIEKLLLQAEELHLRGDQAGAKDKALQILKIEPDHPETHHLVARIEETLRKEKADTLASEIKKDLASLDLERADRKLRLLSCDPLEAERAENLSRTRDLSVQRAREDERRKEREGREKQAHNVRASLESDMLRGDFASALSQANLLMSVKPDDPESRALLKTCEERYRCSQIEQRKQDYRQRLLTLAQTRDYQTMRSLLLELIVLAPGDEEVDRWVREIPDLQRIAEAQDRARITADNRAKAERLMQEARNLFCCESYRPCSTKLREAISLDPDRDDAPKLLRRALAAEATPLEEDGSVRFVNFGQNVA